MWGGQKGVPQLSWLEDFLRFLFFPQMSPVSFAVSGFTIFLLCLRFAYTVSVSAHAGLLCLDLPTRAYAYHIIFDFATRPAFGASVVCVLSCHVFACFAYPGLGRDCQLG